MITTHTMFRPRRDDTRVRFDQALADRAQWRNPMFVAKQLQTALANPARVFDTYLATRAEAAAEFRRLNPSAVRLLGDAVVAAATPEKSACRWCHSVAYSKIRQVPMPDPTSFAVRSLLGPPCQHPASLRAQMDAVLKRVEPARRAVRARARSATFKALLASGQVVEKDRRGRPTRLRTRAAAVTCATCGVPGGGPGCGCTIVHPTETPWPQQTATMTLGPRVRFNRLESGQLR